MVLFILFLVGAVLVPAGDVVHVLTKTTFYNPSQLEYTLFGIIPYWVPLLFGFGGVGAGIHTRLVRNKFPRKREVKTSQVLISACVFIGMYFLSGLLPKTWITDAVLLLCSVGLFAFVGDLTVGGVLQALGVMIGGTGFEIFLIHQDVFSYTDLHNELFGVAPWLPFLYLGVAVSADSLMKWWTPASLKQAPGK